MNAAELRLRLEHLKHLTELAEWALDVTVYVAKLNIRAAAAGADLRGLEFPKRPPLTLSDRRAA